jgi:protein-tyrosine phosphatase
MAEAIFNDMCEINGVEAKSAGIRAIEGSKTSLNSSYIVKKNLNIDITERKAVLLNEKLIDESDLILAMTEDIELILKKIYSKDTKKIFSLPFYVGVKCDVVDPYGMDTDAYEETFSELNNFIQLLIMKIKQTYEIK